MHALFTTTPGNFDDAKIKVQVTKLQSAAYVGAYGRVLHIITRRRNLLA